MLCALSESHTTVAASHTGPLWDSHVSLHADAGSLGPIFFSKQLVFCVTTVVGWCSTSQTHGIAVMPLQ